MLTEISEKREKQPFSLLSECGQREAGGADAGNGGAWVVGLPLGLERLRG